MKMPPAWYNESPSLGSIAENRTITPTNVDEDDDDHDEVKDDPDLVDGLLSKELLELSVGDRTGFQEEIHGVRCLAPVETPEFIRDSLERLQYELDHVIPTFQKEAFLQSQQLPKPKGKRGTKSNGGSSNNKMETYVNTEAFRLRFLRCELFDVPKAALRMVRFLELAKDLYGEYALRRPIRLSDFTKGELKHVRKGRYQFLPYRDRGGQDGRKVLCVFPDDTWEAIPPRIRNKILVYYTWVAGENDASVQREGIVFLVWFDPAFQLSKGGPSINAKDHETITVRPCAVHCCSPDTPFYRFRRSIMTMRIGKHNRTRFIAHLGESVELMYQLQAYGIDTEHIPITYAGNVKVAYLKQWMNLRRAIEEEDEKNEDRAESGSERQNRIESPYLSDIIFRKGASLLSHPGNAALRSLIVARVRNELLLETQGEETSSSSTPASNRARKTKAFVSQIIRDLRETNRTTANGDDGVETTSRSSRRRFLVWNEVEGWWEVLVNTADIHHRVEYIARGIRNTVVRTHKASRAFEKKNSSNARLEPRTPSPAGPATAAAATSTPRALSPTAIHSAPNHPPLDNPTQQTKISLRGISSRNQQHLNGGTSVFRFQDHSEPLCYPNKRRLLETQTTPANDSTDYEEERNFCGEAECFGRIFHSTTLMPLPRR